MNPIISPYILKPDDQLFFLHIPKTAGTTLISLLDQHYAPEEICPVQLTEYIHEVPPEILSTYRLIRGHLDYDFYRLLPKKPIYITMLRNPLKRVISLYEYWKRNSEDWVSKSRFYKDIFREAVNSDLYDFVCSDDNKIRLEVENNQTRRIVANTRDPLEHYTDQEILGIAKKRIAEEFLFCGIVEKFDESVQMLCYALGWPPVKAYEKKMVSPKQIILNDLPVQTRDAILERNQLDIALYEFAWDLFNERYASMLHQFIERSYLDHFRLWNFPKDRLNVMESHSFRSMSWYPLETAPDGMTFRWMGPQKETVFDVSLPRNCNLAVTIDIVNSIHSTLLNDLKFYVNDIELPLIKLSGNEYLGVFQGVITQHMVDENLYLTRLKLTVNRTFSPQELFPNSADMRQLSLAVHEITIESVQENVNLTKNKEKNILFNLVSKLTNQ